MELPFILTIPAIALPREIEVLSGIFTPLKPHKAPT
jgi:hypothetical protein